MKTRKRIYAWTFIWIMMIQILIPVQSFALTGGPSQPEFSAFEPIGTTEMVNLPSGDFQYNIPLMDVGGYPLNMSYHSGITADMEASCVGLGWTINPGVINRNVRAIPDDFKGSEDGITKEFNMRPNTTVGASTSASFELFGLDPEKMKVLDLAGGKLGLKMGVFYNNYWGIGYEFGLTPSFSAGIKGYGKLTAGMGMSANSQSGANFSPSLSYTSNIEKKTRNYIAIGGGIGLSVNSREGLKALSINASIDGDGGTKKIGVNGGIGSSASWNFAGQTFTPQISMPQNNLSVNFSFKPVGGAFFGSNATASSFSGYFSTQSLRNTIVTKPSYGLLYADYGFTNHDALMDFNREKDAAFNDYDVNLPLTISGNDVLSLSGQGIGGSFQLKRSDVPMFFDSKSVAISRGGSLGLEAGSGGVFHGGIDISFNHTSSTSKKWTAADGNELLSNYNFVPSTSDINYESAYYKAAGEMAVESDLSFYNNTGKDYAVRAELYEPTSDKFAVDSKANLIYNNNIPVSNQGKTTRKKRERRNQSVSYLTAAEAGQIGLERQINSYKLNQFYGPQSKARPTPRISADRKSHHISQIASVRTDGLRYVYGIPAYNLSQKEVTFNVAGKIVDCKSGKISYNPGSDNTTDNKLGKDYYYNSVKTPAYAHSYLLTSVLSQDYEDMGTANGGLHGPSIDDYGSYTLFKYSKTTESNNPYKWRVPFQKNSANYNPGLFSVTDDEKGSYIYGTKEIWLVHSVESKTMVAEFTYEKRADGYGVENEDGGLPTTINYNPNKKLEKITLYSKPDRILNKADAIPIKTVHFEYNYELCPETPNSKDGNQGKLTLKSVYFTYGHSKKGKLSPYKFNYKGSGIKYNIKSYDRWGNYKLNEVDFDCNAMKTFSVRNDNKIPNDEFPYSEQDDGLANLAAGTWSLENIELPSGGEIDVNYKAKHYSHVQDKPAMRMMKITGIGKKGSNKLYDLNSKTENLRVFFDSGSHSTEDYLKGVLRDSTYVYLKCFVRMNTGPINSEKWEYVSLYSKISDYGTDTSGDSYVTLMALEYSNNTIYPTLNPISKYSFQFIREHMPEVAYDQQAVTFSNILANPLNTIKPLISVASQLTSFALGFNKVMLGRGYARVIDIEKGSHKGRSLIRLMEPDGLKYGGGAMVSKIEISDNWGNMTGNSTDSFSYGQEYDYTKKDNNGKVVSSGVASYEPMIGGEENPHRKPVVVSQERKWAVDNVHFVEGPFGESFMPSPQVVFSEIKVRNLQYTQPDHPHDVIRTATGHSVMKYYTARDFPLKAERSDLQKEPRRVRPILSLLKVKMKEHMNASQGFYIETNNMHGQAKAKEVVDENGTLISKVEYFYKTKSNGELDNRVDVINSNGNITVGLLGVDRQLSGDSRESLSNTQSGGINLNIDGFTAGPIPVVIPIPWPNYERNERRYRSISMTKVVNKYGVLDSIVAYDLGSTIATHNLAYDAETGEVLLTRTFNEFDDPVYNLKLPAHLAYEGMQGAYQNIGLTTQISNQGMGSFKVENLIAPYDNPFVPGDELALYSSNGVAAEKAWVLHTKNPGNQIFLINERGDPITAGYTGCKIIRSGHRNMPMASIGSITSQKNPINGIGANRSINGIDGNTGILNAGAIEYSQNWQTFCNAEDSEKCQSGPNMNPFVKNVLGNWKPKKSWLYLTERDKKPLANLVSNTNIRENGNYMKFSPYWNSNGDELWRKDARDWIWTTEVTQFNPNGTELENIDKLDRYSAEIVGYANQLVTGVAANSRYKQIAFDGFEDYYYNAILERNNQCKLPRHFGHDINLQHIDRDNHHTGNYSIKTKIGLPLISTYKIKKNCPSKSRDYGSFSNNNMNRNNETMSAYSIDDCDCIQSFSPDAGKYVVTAWVKESSGLGVTNYENHKLGIKTNSKTNTFKASGTIIDGWQRIEGVFDIGASDSDIIVGFEATGTQLVYFDDLRIFPFDGDMKNFVYDDISLKLLSEIDANGYANFYEYDLSGELIRIKKETERGIMTIQESRSAQPKQ